jgi:dTDP-glucose 4,6-dehydratase
MSFVQTNVFGTFTVLEVALLHWHRLTAARKNRFRLVPVSTDEVSVNEL